jgi:methyl-accepting chemotaxis protein
MKWTIRSRMMVYIVPTLFVVGIASTFIVNIVTRSAIEELAYGKALESARQNANQLDAELSSYLIVVQTLARTLESYKSNQREEVKEMLHHILENNFNALGVSVAYEPNAFDGKDKKFINAAAHDATGRFIPYWNRLPGEVVLEPLQNVDHSDWYTAARAAKSEFVTEPYVTKDVLMVSYVSSILKNGLFQGVVKLDVSLDYFDHLVNDIQLFKTGYAFLVSGKGVFVVYRDHKFVGVKSLQELAKEKNNPALAQLVERIKESKEGYIQTTDPMTQRDVAMFHAPVRTGNWGLIIVVPTDEILSNVSALTAAIGLMGLLTVVIIGVTMFIVSGRLSVPIREITVKMDEADLNTILNSQRDDEIGQLTRSFDKFIGSIKQTLAEVNTASNAVASTTKHIFARTESIAVNANEQTLQTNNVTTAIEEMSRTVYEISHSAMNTKEMALHAQASAEQGGQVIEQTVSGINRIVNIVKQSSDVIYTLNESSGKIGKVLNIIEDITKQINLIALNASIEATKAGEKGKGFSVVADEIKKLAERTAHSTTEISDMINKIQGNVSEAVGLMNKSKEEADSGIILAHEAKSSLKEISDVFQEVTQMVNQIAVSSQQQSVTSDQITENVKMINSTTQQVASGIQQIAKSADYLNSLTANVQKLMRQFKVNKSEPSVSNPPI